MNTGLCFAALLALVRIGLVSDTHVGAFKEDEAVFDRLERSYRLFREHEVTNIFNLGDIAEKNVDA